MIETRNTRHEFDELGHKLQRSELKVEQLSERNQQSLQQCALMEVRLNSSQRESDHLGQQLTEQRQQNRLLELLLAKAEVTMENLRASQVAPEEATPPQDEN